MGVGCILGKIMVTSREFKYRKMTKRYIVTILLSIGCALSVVAQKNFQYNNMDSWFKRDIKESRIIGGGVKTLYEVGKPGSSNKAEAWDQGDSPWETSSVYAHVMGIDKVSSTVFPEKRGDGYCVRMETVLEEVYVFGFIHVTALATGSLFTGKLLEPIQNVSDPMEKMSQGIPYTKRLKALKFDYKAKTGGKRIKASALSKSDVPGKNAADVSVFLQKRWEDKDGNIKCKRIATAYLRITESTPDWINGYELQMNYGDISKEPYFKEYMKLNYEGYPLYSLNSKGKMSFIDEVGWGDENDQPTHIIVRFSAGYGGAYVGAIGDCLWIDNVEFVE